MKRWLLVWEVSVNRFSEVHYYADNIADVLAKWQAGHKTGDLRGIVKIEMVEE